MFKRALSTVAVLGLAAAPLAIATPAAASHTNVTRASVNNFVYGTQSSRTFTVTATVDTESPEQTDVSFSLEPANPDCLMFEYGELQWAGGNTFTGSLLLTQSDVYGNACAGDWKLETSAFDLSSFGGYDADERIVRFKRQSRVINDNASPEPVAKGGTVRVVADLQRASWNTFTYGGISGRSAELQFKPTGGSYATIKSVTSSSTGRLSTSVQQFRSGCYRWLFRGFSTTAPSTSAGDCVAIA